MLDTCKKPPFVHKWLHVTKNIFNQTNFCLIQHDFRVLSLGTRIILVKTVIVVLDTCKKPPFVHKWLHVTGNYFQSDKFHVENTNDASPLMKYKYFIVNKNI